MYMYNIHMYMYMHTVHVHEVKVQVLINLVFLIILVRHVNFNGIHQKYYVLRWTQFTNSLKVAKSH